MRLFIKDMSVLFGRTKDLRKNGHRARNSGRDDRSEPSVIARLDRAIQKNNFSEMQHSPCGMAKAAQMTAAEQSPGCDLFAPLCLLERLRSSRRAYTLVELLISLALLAVLFTLLGSMLHGMSRISRLAEDGAVRDREMSFCFDLMRKELGEMVLDQRKADFNMLSGENFIAYTTTRTELLARNSIPGGVKRVEWRFEPAEKRLVRTVSMLIDGKRTAAAPAQTRFFQELKGFEIYVFDGVDWLRMTGISELVPQTTGLCVRLIFPSERDDQKDEFFESAFLLPNETFQSK